MTKKESIEFIKIILNLDTTPSYIYLDVSNSLDNIKDYEMFIKEFKSLYGTLKLQLEYKTAFQKFLLIMEVFNNQRFALTKIEQQQKYKFIDELYENLTWYFNILSEGMPTDWELENHKWKHFKRGKKGQEEKILFNEKKLKVCNMLGNTRELYRLSTKRKTQLKESIEIIVDKLIKENKTNKVAIGYENNPVAKLMNKGK